MTWSEMQVRNRLMKNFINRVNPPLVLTLNRPTWTVTNTGGVQETTTTTLEPQRFGFMPFKRRLVLEKIKTTLQAGDVITTNVHWVLLCTPDQDIQTDDWFIIPDDDAATQVGLAPGKYTVEFVSGRLHDHKQAGIVYHGTGVVRGT